MREVLISIVIVFHIRGGVFDGSFQSMYVEGLFYEIFFILSGFLLCSRVYFNIFLCGSSDLHKIT